MALLEQEEHHHRADGEEHQDPAEGAADHGDVAGDARGLPLVDGSSDGRQVVLDAHRRDDTPALGVLVGDTVYVVDYRGVSGLVERDLIAQTGLSLAQLEVAPVGPYVASAIAWLARRTAGEDVAFESVASAITAGDVIRIPSPELLAELLGAARG